jgi:hypothetical protein
MTPIEMFCDILGKEKCKMLLSSTTSPRCVVDSELNKDEAVRVVDLRGLVQDFGSINCERCVIY